MAVDVGENGDDCEGDGEDRIDGGDLSRADDCIECAVILAATVVVDVHEEVDVKEECCREACE